MSGEKDWLDFVANDGLGYAIMDGSYIDSIQDEQIKYKVKRAHKLFRQIEEWVEKHPDYEPM